MNKQDKIDGNDNNKSNTYLDMHKHSNLKLCLSVLEIGLLGRIVGERGIQSKYQFPLTAEGEAAPQGTIENRIV